MPLAETEMKPGWSSSEPPQLPSGQVLAKPCGKGWACRAEEGWTLGLPLPRLRLYQCLGGHLLSPEAGEGAWRSPPF